jgi:glucosamine 6-phosphate synthetase-like amidotransferase/phosphosugar isomerase protein
VRNHSRLARQYDLRLASECDTEVLGCLAARRGGHPVDRIAWAASQAEGPLVVLGLWADPIRLVVCRRGNPLWFGQGPRGCYLGSFPEHLPGQPTEVPDGRSYQFSVLDGEVCQSRRELSMQLF